jgi:hypothetical protein
MNSGEEKNGGSKSVRRKKQRGIESRRLGRNEKHGYVEGSCLLPFNTHAKHTTQPMRVHPKNKLTTKIEAAFLCLRLGGINAQIVGTQ